MANAGLPQKMLAWQKHLPSKTPVRDVLFNHTSLNHSGALNTIFLTFYAANAEHQ
jgi:hypothetical protein